MSLVSEPDELHRRARPDSLASPTSSSASPTSLVDDSDEGLCKLAYGDQDNSTYSHLALLLGSIGEDQDRRAVVAEQDLPRPRLRQELLPELQVLDDLRRELPDCARRKEERKPFLVL